ncbi:MAG: LysM peptidoglycan-binding domain-containing protein [Nitrospira sp.]|jgi:LysM repeat protein|nr:LysM peptidoglycan-binding domain-containing protein [Nitrospira sp. BO4]
MGRNTAVGILLLGISACSSFEPLVEQETSDLQLTVDALKTSLNDAQRALVDLRVEVETRRQEFTDAQITRAQLEGRIREAERRLTEARHVIDLQREELASSRTERDRARRTGAALQSQLKQLQKYQSKMGRHTAGEMPTAMAFPRESQLELATMSLQEEALSDDIGESTGVISQPAIHLSRDSSVGAVPSTARPSTMTTDLPVLIKPGDTLWSLAQRHRTSVKRLMEINALSNDHIQAGQVLWLTESSTSESEHERM